MFSIFRKRAQTQFTLVRFCSFIYDFYMSVSFAFHVKLRRTFIALKYSSTFVTDLDISIPLKREILSTY